jgi:NAD(P)H-hydrate epimerase
MEEQERIQQIVDLLQETRREHHRAYAETNGADPQWPSWYAERIHEQFNALLESPLTESEIAEQLSALEEEHRDEAPEVNWAEYYARALLKWSIRR